VSNPSRHLSLFATTALGVGAMMDGGILALAGVAFASAGPGALAAFALNAVIVILTALSYAELSTAFPQSGGIYVFAKRVLSVSAAFSVGWIFWFASIVAASLYALGFASFALQSAAALWPSAPAWLSTSSAPTLFSLFAIIAGTGMLSRSPGSSGSWINVLKVIAFGILILGGAWAWMRIRPSPAANLAPMYPHGASGLFLAMGYTFIAFQGYDLIPSIAGEVKNPRRALPRAIFLSMGIGLALYLPLLVLVAILGVPEGGSIEALARTNPETLVARAVRHFLGTPGYWLVMISGVLALSSAMLAYLFAASRIAQAMARDRTLPSELEGIHSRFGTPLPALLATAAISCALLLIFSDISRAGAASSLIFLVMSALAHLICVLARKRRPNHEGFRTPAWPLFPVVGAAACAALAGFQGVAVPAAGLVIGAWLILGFICYLWIFGPRARVSDAASELSDPDLLELRGRSPLVLVPIANPASAGTLALLASSLLPRAGRVLLLNIVRPPKEGDSMGEGLQSMSDVLRRSMEVSLQAGVRVECMATIAANPWGEIERVARAHRCAMTLLGMADLSNESTRSRIEELISRLPGNMALVRMKPDWQPKNVRRVLVPIGGRGVHNTLRARLLTALRWQAPDQFEVRYLIVVPETTSESEGKRLKALWSKLVMDECDAPSDVHVVPSQDVAAAVIDQSADCDLILLGMGREGRQRRVIGSVVSKVINATDRAVLMISQRE